MPSRVKLKLEIMRYKGLVVEQAERIKFLEGSDSVYQKEIAKLQKEYQDLNKEWKRFQKEYDNLSMHWNAFQGMVHRPTPEDMVRMRATGEMVNGIAQALVKLFFPNGVQR